MGGADRQRMTVKQPIAAVQSPPMMMMTILIIIVVVNVRWMM